MVWLALVSLGVLVLMAVYMKMSAASLNRRREYRADFYEAANKLLDDDRVSVELASAIMGMANLLTDRRLPWRIARGMVTGTLRRYARGSSRRRPAGGQKVEALPKELRGLLEKVLVSWVLAVTFNAPPVGWLVRRTLLFNVSKIGKRQFRGGEDARAIAEWVGCRNGAAA